MQLLTLSWSQCSFTLLKILGLLRIMLNLFCLCSRNGTKKPIYMIAHLFTIWIIEYFWDLLLRTNYSFENNAAHWQARGHPRALMEMNEINVFMLLTFILQSVDQGVISIFKSYYLRNTFHNAIVAIVIPLMDLGKLKTFWKRFTILY